MGQLRQDSRIVSVPVPLLQDLSHASVQPPPLAQQNVLVDRFPH
jgi:hypothetical protein